MSVANHTSSSYAGDFDAESVDRRAPASRSHVSMASLFAEPSAYVDVGQARLAYYTIGEGPDVFFVHGWPVHSATFRRVLPFFASRYRCHLVDLPGAGSTEVRPGGAIELRAHAATVRRAIDELGLRRFAFVAHDSGGAVARMAAAGDDRVAGLVLGGTEIPGHRPWLIVLYAALSHLPGTERLFQKLMRSRAVRTSSLGFRGCFTDPSYAEGEFGELFVEPILRSPAVLRGHMALMKSLDFGVIEALRDVHAQIHAPTRLIWGSDDPFFPVKLAKEMVAEFAGPAELVEIAAAKLFAHEDHPERFAALSTEFLDRCFERFAEAPGVTTST